MRQPPELRNTRYGYWVSDRDFPNPFESAYLQGNESHLTEADIPKLIKLLKRVQNETDNENFISWLEENITYLESQ